MRSRARLPKRKRCAHCRRIRPARFFYLHKTGRDAGRLVAYCKDCTNKLCRERYRRQHESPAHLRFAIIGQRAIAPTTIQGVQAKNGCKGCPALEQCQDRVQFDMSLPVLCEYPDQADLQRARAMHGEQAEALLGLTTAAAVEQETHA